MSQHSPKLYAVLAVACIALGLSIYTVVRGPSAAKPTSSSACVDQEARTELGKLRRALADRDAFIARLTRTLPAQSGAATTGEQLSRPSTPPESGPRRYTHFEIPNPAVSVTQKDDGTFDIRTTDPTLAGSILQVTAVTQAGVEDQLMIRIPQ